MTAPERQNELLGRFTGADDELYDVEYVGQFRVSGNLTLRVMQDKIADAWRRSIVPDHYMPLFGLKCGPPENAGGLFDGAPFAVYDPGGPQFVGMNAPSPPEPIYDFCTDNCGCQFWLSKTGSVYGHNLDNEIQRIGTLDEFVDFAVSLALDGINWYTKTNDPEIASAFGLSKINTMG